MEKINRPLSYIQFMPKGTIIQYEELKKLGFFTVPASIRFHGNYTGGLFDHSFTVAKTLVELTEKLGLEWERPESPYIVGMYHDLCKCDQYVEDPASDGWRYNARVIVPDHGAKSVIIASRYIRLTLEEEACIRWHMGAYETDPKMWDYYGRAIEEELIDALMYIEHLKEIIPEEVRKGD